jgi:hypothetical protein
VPEGFVWSRIDRRIVTRLPGISNAEAPHSLADVLMDFSLCLSGSHKARHFCQNLLRDIDGALNAGHLLLGFAPAKTTD